MLNNDCDIAACDYESVESNTRVDLDKKLEFNLTILNQYEAFDSLYAYWDIHKMIITVSPCNKLYRKEIFDDVRYPVGMIREDEHVIHKILYNIKKMAYIDCKYYFNCNRNDSIMARKNILEHYSFILALYDRIDFFEKKNVDKNIYYKSLRHFINEGLNYNYSILNIDNEESEKIKVKLKRQVKEVIDKVLE